jgi:hypothetical protein
MGWCFAVLCCTLSNYIELHNQLGPLTPITKTYVSYHTNHTTILMETIVTMYVISHPSLALGIRMLGCVHMICEGCRNTTQNLILCIRYHMKFATPKLFGVHINTIINGNLCFESTSQNIMTPR